MANNEFLDGNLSVGGTLGVVGNVTFTGQVNAASTLLIKPESLQPTGAFKLRGAYNAVYAVTRDLDSCAKPDGVVAHSSGNHGQAVAYAAALLGMPAVVVVPAAGPSPPYGLPAYARRARKVEVFVPQIYLSLTMLGDQEGSLISQQDGSHGSQPGKPHSRARLRVLERR